MIELSPEIWFWLVICLAGLCAGFIDAIVGGGGMLTIPALLTTGLPPHVVLGTNKLAASFGSFTASYTFIKSRLFSPHFWRVSLVSTAFGAILGTIFVNFIDTGVLFKVLPILILLVAIYTIFNDFKSDVVDDLPKKNSRLTNWQIVQGFSLGFYDGAAGPGTGAFWTISSSYLYKMNILLCSGLARSNNFISNFFSLIAFMYFGQVNFVTGLSLGFFIMIGSYVGARSAIKQGVKFIKPIFIAVVIAMSINLAYSAWT